MIFLKITEKHSTKSVIETEVKLMSWLSNISLKKSKIFHKDKNGDCCDENHMDSEVEVTF